MTKSDVVDTERNCILERDPDAICEALESRITEIAVLQVELTEKKIAEKALLHMVEFLNKQIAALTAEVKGV
jgi:hypothetical protein